MKLKEMVLNNFRQFYEKQKIYFSKSQNKNVTVFHGENGSGKTALLNAFYWVMYEEIFLPEPENLLNEKKEAELDEGDSCKVFVEIKFRDDGKDYEVRRSQNYKKNDGSIEKYNTDLSVEYISDTGETRSPNNPQNTIEQVLPKRLKGYFFFDGEHINKLAKKSGSGKIENAIKNIMGLEVLERAERHIGKAKKKFYDDIEEHEENEEISSLNKENKKLREEINEKKNKIEQLEKNNEALEDDIEDIDNQLRNLETTKDLQNRKDELKNEKNELSKKIKATKDDLNNLISNLGSLVFLDEALNKSAGKLNDKIDKGEIPSGIKKVFVEDLLENNECICGTDLKNNNSARNRVKEWKEKAGDTEIEKIFIDLKTKIGTLIEKRKNFFEKKESYTNTLEDLKKRRREINEEIDEIDSDLENEDSEEISQLISKKKEHKENLKENEREIGTLTSELEDIQKDIRENEQTIKKLEVKKSAAKLAQKRANALDNVQDIVSKLYEKNAEQVRQKVQSEISDVYKKFLRKNYEPDLDENYNLRIYKKFDENNKSVAMSRGERQITSLSFIGTLVKIAKEQKENKNNDLSFQGGIYPIVMDSPFGALDIDHRRRIASGIPLLAKQIVLMASDSQWEGEVSKQMKPNVGKEYKLNYFDPEEDESIEYEFTLIEEM